jgi:hypothetical protein
LIKERTMNNDQQPEKKEETVVAPAVEVSSEVAADAESTEFGLPTNLTQLEEEDPDFEVTGEVSRGIGAIELSGPDLKEPEFDVRAGASVSISAALMAAPAAVAAPMLVS